MTSEFETVFFDSDLFTDGSASADTSGSGDIGPLTLGAGETGNISAMANGEVTGGEGFAGSYWEADGYFFIDNQAGQSSITGDVNFDISWFASIFTDSGDEEAYGGVSVYIEDFSGAIIFDDFYEFDSVLDGPGALGTNGAITVSIADLTIGGGRFEEYYIEVGAGGFAESFRPAAVVPEPAGVFLAGLALLLAVRKRKMN